MRPFLTRSFAAVAAASLLSFALPASAARMFADFTGFVTEGNGSGETFDDSNFWQLGDALIGASFTARFLYDTDLGLSTTDLYGDLIAGGPDVAPGELSPILSAWLTIGDVTDTFDVTGNGLANVIGLADGWRQTYLYTDFFGPTFGNALQLYVLNSPSPLNLTTPFSGSNLPGLENPTTDPFALKIDGEIDYWLALATNTVTLSAAPIPEPGTWALMIGGLLLVGGALRGQRSHGGFAAGRGAAPIG